jgi:hypothetical protein
VSDAPSGLAAFLESIAAGLPDVEAAMAGDATVYGTNGTDFAVVRPADASFRLRLDVARAALGTPDTSPGPEGRDWVRFTPRAIMAYELDRAEAWFVVAHRFAARPGAGRRSPH